MNALGLITATVEPQAMDIPALFIRAGLVAPGPKSGMRVNTHSYVKMFGDHGVELTMVTGGTPYVNACLAGLWSHGLYITPTAGETRKHVESVIKEIKTAMRAYCDGDTRNAERVLALWDRADRTALIASLTGGPQMRAAAIKREFHL